jgi:hypothetical protein
MKDERRGEERRGDEGLESLVSGFQPGVRLPAGEHGD